MGPFKSCLDVLRTVAIKRLRRIYLRPLIYLENSKRKEDINVIIVVRNRYDDRIINSLKSIRRQTYPQDLIKITVIDYDSDSPLVQKYMEICRFFEVEYIRVENKPVWCKSHALNIAIKRTREKYILSSDVDILFEDNYIKEAVNKLRKNPFQIILSDMLDLPRITINELNFDELKSLAESRYKGSGYVIAIPLTLTYFFQKIRGYDERYKLWGKEDDDLIKRLKMLGLDKVLLEKSYHLHQWHPKHEGIDDSDFEKHLAMNTAYFENTKSLMRNKNFWGEVDKANH